MKTYVDVYGVRVEVIERPEYNLAHPDDESCQCAHCRPLKCEGCALGIRPDTGDLILLWLCDRKNWGVSRETPNYIEHRDALLNMAGAA